MTLQREFLKLFMAMTFTVIGQTAFAHEDDHDEEAPKVIHQYGLPLTLMNTIYEGDITAKQMRQLGDIGVGVSNHLNGELTAVDGVIYSIAGDGTATVAPDDLQAPYMSMLKFEPTKTITLTDIGSFKELQDAITAQITSINSFYAFKAKGTFTLAHLASAHGVEDEDVDFFEYLGSRQMYDLTDTEGTVVGIYTPDYLGNISIPGLHFHFQNGDNTVGGHLEDIRFERMDFEVEEFDRMNLVLPNGPEFRSKKMQVIAPPSGAGAGGTEASK